VFWNRKAKKLKEEYANNPHLATADVLTRLVKRCPSCKGEMAGHEFSRCATKPILKGDQDLQKFFQVLIGHEWEQLGGFHDWTTDGDNVEVYALRCTGERLSVVAIKAQFEHFMGSRLLHHEALSDKDGKELLAVFPHLEWRSFRRLD
jgi:hypothetical protein